MEDFVRFPVFHNFDQFGTLGVELFFILSAFLITGILLGSKDKEHYLRNFFARRTLRIWPLYYAVLLIVMLSGAVHAHGANYGVYALFISNLVYGHKPQPSPLDPMWSLAVEEQFYLVWPFVVLFLPKKWLSRLAFVLLIAVPLIRMYSGLDARNTLCHLDALALGVIVACNREWIMRFSRWMPIAALALPIGMIAQVLHDSLIVREVELLGCTALLCALLNEESAISSVLRNRFLRYVGRISYGIYLLHALVFCALRVTRVHQYLVSSGSMPQILLYLVFAYAAVLVLASASYFAFERPILKLKRYFESPDSKVKKDQFAELVA